MKSFITADLSQFGMRELMYVRLLLEAYTDKGSEFLGTGLTVNFNLNSGYVFLSDDEYNVGVLEGKRLVQFYTCVQCGYEGTQEEALTYERDFLNNQGYCSPECEEKNR